MSFFSLNSTLFPIDELDLSFQLPITPADTDQGKEGGSIALSEGSAYLPQTTWPDAVNLPYAQKGDARSNSTDAPTGRRIRRRQNHSCDPCRLAKRACDLPRGVAIEGNKPPVACSMCSIRSTECTVAWLAGRKHSCPAQKRPARSTRSPSTLPARSTSTRSPDYQKHMNDPSAEWDQARQLIAQDQCAQQVHLYIDVVDIPLSACLSQRCLPPCYSLGIAALAPLSSSTDLSSCFDRARSSINLCWDIHVPASATLSTAPQLFLAVSVLDAIFQNPGTSARDNSIAEAFKWMAIATATQFAAHETDQSPSHTKDIAFASWQKARDLLFQNIGATGSFRLALSLVLFGAILPPTGSQQSSSWAEDVAFAHREGARRLRGLCAKTRGYLQPGRGKASSPSLSLCPEVKSNLLELVGAIEWFFCMSHSATIAASSNPTGPTALDADYAAVKGFLIRSGDYEQTLETSIVARAQATDHPVSALWCQDMILPDDELIYSAVNHAGSIVVLLFRSLALLILVSQDLLRGAAQYADFQQHYTAVTRLIDSWRTTFGRMTPEAIAGLGRLPAVTRRCVLFCATDAELAILLFDELLRELNDRLAEMEISSSSELPAAAHNELRATLRSTDPYRQDERLISAMHISYLASTNIGVSSPGSGGQGQGLKATVQDIGAHPQPALAIKAYTLAARTFADEMQSLVARVETQGVGEMANGLENCLQGLQALKQTLVMFPDSECGDS